MSAPSPPERRSPRIKVCGVTSAADARLAVELGAELLGLNFYPRSPRAIDLDRAREIRDVVGERVLLVGVLVNAPSERTLQLLEGVPLDLLQFHGEESWSEIGPFAERAIKAFRGGADLDRAELEPFAGAWGWLFDTAHPTLRGGTGQTWDYGAIGGLLTDRRVLVAGGIGPDNAAAVCSRLPGVWGLDVCSRVESAPGVKDRALLERLFAAVRGDLNVKSNVTSSQVP